MRLPLNFCRGTCNKVLIEGARVSKCVEKGTCVHVGGHGAIDTKNVVTDLRLCAVLCRAISAKCMYME